MRYVVAVEEREFTVDLTGDQLVVDGRDATAELRALPGTPLRQLVMPGTSETFAMRRTADRWQVQHAGRSWEIEVVDERTRQLREMTRHGTRAGTDQVVAAPMPGLVLRIEVEVGAPVRRGTGILVLEAMKMENELTSPIDGVVRAILVEPGQPVDKGARLVEVSADG